VIVLDRAIGGLDRLLYHPEGIVVTAGGDERLVELGRKSMTGFGFGIVRGVVWVQVALHVKMQGTTPTI